jgi:TPR repeat protein
MEARNATGVAIAIALSVSGLLVSAQAPPPEMAAHVLMDVGPISAAAVCGCVTAPFTVLAPRPGWGYGGGTTAPDTNAAPSAAARRRQREQNAEDLANLEREMEDALEGNSASAFGLGLLFTAGSAVKRDDVAAGQWFTLAARYGHPNADVQLGHRYLRGVGFAPNDQTAAYWFYKGAASGDRIAMIALGGLYAAGRGVGQDWAGALYWWKRAGYWRFVGDAYACGLGVLQDNERALAAYQKGSAAGDAGSTIQVGHMHAGGCTERPDAEAAFNAYKKAADEGYPEGQVGLSQLYLEGRGTARSPYNAYMWARLAELRLEPGELQRLASARASAAAVLMPAFEINDADRFVKAVIAAGATPMNR